MILQHQILLLFLFPVIQILKKKFLVLSLGGASASMMTYGLLFWFPSF